MKKIALICSFFFALGLSSSFAQVSNDFKLAAHIGLPVGDVADATDFHVAADVSYLVGLIGILEAGPMLGYSRYLASSDFDDASFIPVAASGRVDLGSIVGGLDLGYAIGLNDGNDGGVYLRPKIGFGFFGLNVIGSYSNISSDSENISSVNLGLEFGF